MKEPCGDYELFRIDTIFVSNKVKNNKESSYTPYKI